MNNEIVEKFNNQTFTQGSAFLKVKNYNPPDLLFQNLPIRETVTKQDVYRKTNGYIFDFLTTVDIQKIVYFCGKVIQIYEDVSYRENFRISPIQKVIRKLFNLRLKYKKECNDLMEGLVELLRFYGENLRKYNDEEYKCKCNSWMNFECDEKVLDYWKLRNGE